MPKISQLYKDRVLQYILLKGSASMQDIKVLFPRAPLRTMEVVDKTIEYRDGLWYARKPKETDDGVSVPAS